MDRSIQSIRIPIAATALLLLGSLPPSLRADGLPLVQTFQTDFVGSGNCAACHSFMTDTTGTDVSIDRHWRSTMMANSAKDPLWQAKVSSEVERAPHLQSVIEEKCATCHMPMARTQAKALGAEVAILGDGFLNESNPFHSLAMDGVSCALCHQITPTALGEQDSFSGGYDIDTSTESPNRLIYGPFPNPVTSQMQNNLGFTPVQSPHISSSGLCATCHNLETPYVDAAGEVLGTFPEQMTYLEWEHSEYDSAQAEGRTCQDCHMPTADGGVVLSNRDGPGLNLQARSPFSQHHFVGGNAMMLGILAENLEERQVTASSQQLEDTQWRVVSQMQSATARLSITRVSSVKDEMSIWIRTESLVGHKFPSGFPSRRAWIHLAVTDANGSLIFDSGRPDLHGRIAGNAADFDPQSNEPHYRVITSDDQVQIYESIMENTDGAITYTLLRGAAYRKDNRLLPKGFDAASADPRIAVVGEAATDANFIGGRDDIEYRIELGNSSGPYMVETHLYYQPVSAAFVADLERDSTAQIATLSQMMESADKDPVTVATVAVAIEPQNLYSLELGFLSADHGPELRILGPASSELNLERSTNLQTWESFEDFDHPTNPSSYIDSSMMDETYRFYRLRWPLDFIEQ